MTMLTLSFVLLILSFVCFLLETFGVSMTRVNINALGLALLVASMLFAGR